ncbi:FtsB family cell division protein [Aerococcus sp. Group 2]|uniref:FtsB family cell division protein n=2 Tax=Aerococcaceae TaxID=186827 RepID=UPI00227C4583|nr:septum formation initiator family protein [Aerococcus sp. Group 2]MCY3036792.1 septum formation initiator family protein [Aerococcus sp. Group 2]
MLKMGDQGKENKNKITSIARYAGKKEQEDTKKQKWHDLIMRSLLGFCLLGSLLCLFGVFHAQIKTRSLSEQTEQAKQQRQSEQEIVDSLKNQVTLLHNESYLASLARAQYYLSKEGEIIFSTPEDNDSMKAKSLNKAYLEAQNNQNKVNNEKN